MRWIVKTAVSAALVMIVATASGWAQIGTYTQDFESLGLPPDSTALSNDGWFYFVNVFDTGTCPAGAYTYNGPAPNGPQMSILVDDQGGAAQGTRQLSVFSDYANTDHGCGSTLEVNIYQQQAVTTTDVGTVVTFTFDAKGTDLSSGSGTAQAFIKVFDGSWAQIGFQSLDMTSIPTTWGTYSMNLTIPAGAANVQFGFMNTATNYDPTGVFYDNINTQYPVELMSLSVE